MRSHETNFLLISKENLTAFRSGLVDGFPIGLGYLAVSFSLGIAAKNAGLSAFQGFLVSLFCMASAGEYVGFLSIGACASYIEIALATFVANARYLLMSTAMSQRLKPGLPWYHRFLMAFAFGISAVLATSYCREGFLVFFTHVGCSPLQFQVLQTDRQTDRQPQGGEPAVG